MVDNMTENGLLESNMVKENTSTRTAKPEKESGKMERDNHG
tara:strand:- start:136 stop:258 length:123 start_codon:yes stop_codon:yes gene_type:complete